MALTDYKQQYDNAYEDTFMKVLVGKEIANTRFESTLKYGASVTRNTYDISGVRVRTVSRGSASTIDPVTDSPETMTVNIEKEAVFYLSDGEVTQAGPLNPGSVIGGKIAMKVAADLDARIFAEVLNAANTFDTGDLTTLASTGVPFALSTSNVPIAISRMRAKLKNKANQTMTNMAIVLDSYGMSDIEQYLLSKNYSIVDSVFKNGYIDGEISGAQVYCSENLTGTAVLTAAGVFVNTQTVTINGVVFTSVDSIGSTAGNFLVGTAAESLGYLAGLINNPGTTSAYQIALSAADQILVTDTYKLSAVATSTTLTVTGIGAGRLTVAETGTNISWGTAILHAYYGKKGAIDLAVQDLSPVDMRPCSDRRGTNIFSSYLAALKTFADGAQGFLDLKLS